MGTVPQELAGLVEAWLAQDPDPATRAEISGLLARGDQAGLRERFEHPLAFGTAGIRGPLGAGPARFNRAVVRRVTAGLARYLSEGPPPRGGTTPGSLPAAWAALAEELVDGPGPVVVGHDARHGSEDFAWDAARVLAASGLRALHFQSALPTPVLAFAVRYLGAAAGVMVTASHNPAPDNGYKVYLADGAQILPPHDAAVAAAAGSASVPSDRELLGPFGDRMAEVSEADVLAAYRRAVIGALNPSSPRRLRSVYSPLHGVGAAVLPGLMEEAGFEPPALVPSQAKADPDFPTVPFPNPEEPGVMDRALAEAEDVGADVVLVNDPDGDRLAVAVAAAGGFRVLTGDELGVLIGAHLLARSEGAGRLVATSVVSSTMLSEMAERSGVAYVETLTGFKWLARAARLRPGHRLLFAYEEALGYAVSDAVADKDGLAAALMVAEMAAEAKDEGRSLLEALDELEATFGVHMTAQWSLPLRGEDGPERLVAVMARWRSAPPDRLAGIAVSSVRDLAAGEGDLPPSDVVVLELGGSGRVVLRPSGTEPKLKIYFEVTSEPCGRERLAEARGSARARLEKLRGAVAALTTGHQGVLP